MLKLRREPSFRLSCPETRVKSVYLQSKLLVPFRIERVGFDGSGPYELGGQGPSDAVPLFSDSSIFSFEAQLEAVVLPELLVIALDVGGAGIRQGAIGGERLRLRRGRCCHRLNSEHAVRVTET